MGFFQSFMGIDQQNDINSGFNKATKDLKQGFDEQTQKYNQARGMYTPYVNQGTRAFTLYNDATGVNGNDARNNAYNIMTSDPFFQNELDQSSNALMRNLNARGLSGGTAVKGAQQVMYDNINNFLNRWKGSGDTGFQASNLGANMTAQQGDNAMGFGATNANLQMGKANALAANRNTGVNNVMGAVGALTGGFNAYNNMNYNNILSKKYGIG